VGGSYSPAISPASATMATEVLGGTLRGRAKPNRSGLGVPIKPAIDAIAPPPGCAYSLTGIPASRIACFVSVIVNWPK
jgi:hypothetical protein